MRRRNFSPTAEKRLEIAGQWLYQPLTNRRADDPPGRAALAQVVEHIIRNDGVAGSSPASGTILHSTSLSFDHNFPLRIGVFVRASKS